MNFKQKVLCKELFYCALINNPNKNDAFMGLEIRELKNHTQIVDRFLTPIFLPIVHADE